LLLSGFTVTTFAAASANAASIAGDSFDATVTFDLGSGGTQIEGPFTGIAGAVDDGFYPSAT
jgi:hypothetical protein